MLAQLRTQLNEAVLSKNEALKSIIRVILGEASTLEARLNKPLTDEQVQSVVRKILLGNTETMKIMANSDPTSVNSTNYLALASENSFLESLLPATLSVTDIKNKLLSIAESLKSAKSDGLAIKTAIGHIKELGLTANGADVTVVVKELRSDSAS